MGAHRIRREWNKRRNGDRGSQIIEVAFAFPIMFLVCAIVLEMFVSLLALDRMEAAARAGARVAGPGAGEVDLAYYTVHQHLPSFLDEADVRIAPNSRGGYYAEVAIDAPILNPRIDLNYTLTRRVDMPNV